jgi:hypothetical protein
MHSRSMLSFSVILTGYHVETFSSVSFTSLGLLHEPGTKGAGYDSDLRKLRITNTKSAAALINSHFPTLELWRDTTKIEGLLLEESTI